MVCLLYGVYLFSQIAYFSGGFLGILPDGYSVAEYARRGFFEMAVLSGINLGLITFSIGMVSRTGDVKRSTKYLCLAIGLVTLFLIGTSWTKMLLYIGTYGLTRLRVLTMAIITFLAITTVLVSLWLFLPRLEYMRFVVLSAMIIGAAHGGKAQEHQPGVVLLPEDQTEADDPGGEAQAKGGEIIDCGHGVSLQIKTSY